MTMTFDLPFTEKPGALFVAPLGTELPDNTVCEGMFSTSWPASWIRVLPAGETTDPDEITVANSIDPATTSVVEFFQPLSITREMLGDWTWFLGPRVAAWRSRFAAPWQTRFMVGWESRDRTERVLSLQAVIERNGVCRLERAPVPAPRPRRRWWQRLLRRWPPVPAPRLHPSFTVYRVGVQRAMPPSFGRLP